MEFGWSIGAFAMLLWAIGFDRDVTTHTRLHQLCSQCVQGLMCACHRFTYMLSLMACLMDRSKRLVQWGL